MPRVSVIIPNYNHERYLQRRIQSVLSQTYQDFELLLMDDASTDNSRDVLRRYAQDSRTQLLLNEVNSGSPFKQWNKGVRAARGEYIWIAESDDYADPTLLEHLVPILDANPDVGVAYCQSWLVDEANVTIGSAGDWAEDLDDRHWKTDYTNRGTEECRRFLLDRNTIPNASAVVFRRKVYEDAGFADESFRLCGDWLLWMKMLLISDVAFVAAPLNYFRRHESTVSHNTMRNGIELVERYRMFAHLAQHSPVLGSAMDRAYQGTLDGWFYAMRYRDGAIPARRNLEILRLARQSDSQLVQRVGRKFMTRFLRTS